MTITLRGYTFQDTPVRDSFQRRALAFQNNIIKTLKMLGVKEDDIEVSMESMAITRKPAYVSWYFNERHHYYSHTGKKFVDNLFIVSKVLSLAVDDLIEGRKTLEDFSSEFQEDRDITDKRKEAREYFGLEENFKMADVDLAYRRLAKDLHPDMPNGDLEKFKKLNEAHKILKREFT